MNFTTVATATRANWLASIFFHTLLDQHMELKDIEKPTHKEFVESEEILQPTPEVAKIEVMKAREEQGKKPAQVGVEII